MSKDKIELIEKSLNLKKIEEYEIYLMDTMIYETEFIKSEIASEREVNKLEYVIRILSQKGKETGIGIVKGNSLELKDIDKNIETCVLLSKHNMSSKYFFPESNSLSMVKTADEKILRDPNGIKNDTCAEINSEIKEHKELMLTFGRFRIHIQTNFLKNSSGLNLDALKTFFYIEFALKAQKNGNLGESWEIDYIKEREHLNIKKRVDKWARIAKDTLRAKNPPSNSNAIVVFPPNVLKNAINPVVGFHASGRAYHEKVSSFKINQKVASEKLTIIDNGLLEGGLMTNSWDGEGNPHQITKFIDSGICKERLFDQKYAILGKINSTGNGLRISDGSVTNTISNLQILPGEIPIDEMILNIKEGFYIEKCSWLSPDNFSGSFGTEIRNGYYIQNGEFRYPIKGGNLSGNVLEMIKNCQEISKENEFSLNSLFPYISFKNLSVSS